MRWRRGLLRLWVVASVGWLLITGAVFRVPQSLLSWHGTPSPATVQEGPFRGLPVLTPNGSPDPLAGLNSALKAMQEENETPNGLWGFLFVGMGPPVMILILGIAGWWVARGFRSVS
jgi:hypothetical protein